MSRLVVLGASGFFGRLIVNGLREAGLQPLTASRSSGDLRIDANDPKELQTGDLVVDAAGPFQDRTSALIEAAVRHRFDVVDLSDSPEYTAQIYERESAIRSAAIRVLTACSALSTLSAWALSEVPSARSLSVYLVPASRHTANKATIASFIRGVEGETRTLHFPPPLGTRRGITVHSVDTVTLPSVRAELVVDSGRAITNRLMRFAMFRRIAPHVLPIIRLTGMRRGVLAFAAEDHRLMFLGGETYMLAVIPAIEAAKAIANGTFDEMGLIPPARHANVAALQTAIDRAGIQTIRASFQR